MSTPPTPERHPRASFLLLAALLLAGTLAVYFNHFDNGFHFDDAHTLVDNADIRSLDNLPRFFTDPTTNSTLPTNRSYRPLVTASLALDYWLAGGLLPFYFHLSTILWYLLQGVLMVVLFRRLLDQASPDGWPARDTPLVALAVTGLYLLHPANAETINYVSARSDSLSTLLALAALLLYTMPAPALRYLALIPLALGALVKPTAVMIVPLMLLYRLFFVHQVGILGAFTRANRPLLLRELVIVAPLVAAAAGLFAFTQAMTPDTWVPGGTSRLHYAMTQPFVLLRYFWTFFLPVGLSADTDWQTLASTADPRFVLGMLFVSLALAAAVAAAERRVLRPIAFGLLWFFLTLLPTSSIIPLAEVTNDHRMFYPFVGLSLAVGWSLVLLLHPWRQWLALHRGARLSLLVLLVAIYGAAGFGTYQRNQIWHDAESLWRDVTEKSPGNGRGLMNYGLALMGKGRFEEALAVLERARGTGYRDHPFLAVNLAIVEEALGRSGRAEAYFAEALRSPLRFPDTHYFYARWLAQRGRDDAAEAELRSALHLAPGHLASRQLAEQLAAKRSARQRQGEMVDRLLDESLALFRTGRLEESMAAVHRALSLDPDSAIAYNNLCAIENERGNWDAAIHACQRAVTLAPDFALARNNLRWAQTRGTNAGHSGPVIVRPRYQ